MRQPCSEGFLVFFHVQDERNFVFWNVSGWDNTRSALEQTLDGDKATIGEPADVTVQIRRWYDVRIDVKGREVSCYLDGKLVTRDTATSDVILKVVNLDGASQKAKIDLPGLPRVSPQAVLEQITGDPNAVNTVDEPTKIAPTREMIPVAVPAFEHEFPGHSISVIRLRK